MVGVDPILRLILGPSEKDEDAKYTLVSTNMTNAISETQATFEITHCACLTSSIRREHILYLWRRRVRWYASMNEKWWKNVKKLKCS